MSSTTKWVIAVLVIVLVLLGLWKWGFLGGSAPTTEESQNAAVVSGAGDVAIDSSDAIIAQESSAIEAQMKVVGNQVAAFSQVPTASKADLLVSQLASVSNLMKKLASRLQSRVAILKNIGYEVTAMQGTMSDMNLQLSYAVSQIGTVGQLATSIKPDNGDSAQANKNSATLRQIKIELQKTQNYLVSVQKDTKTVVDGFKLISASQPVR